MRRPPVLPILVAVVGLALAACASPTASGEPSTAASAAPAESQGGGGGGGANGSVQYEISGGHSASGELPYLPILGGYFQQGGISYLPFAQESGSDTVVIITLSDDGNVFQYSDGSFTVPAAECDWNISRHDATGASGSFTCSAAPGVSADGAFVTVDVRGSFDAHN